MKDRPQDKYWDGYTMRPERQGAVTLHEPAPSQKALLYLPDGTPLVKQKTPLGFKK